MSALSTADVGTAQFELRGHVYSTSRSGLKGARVTCGSIETITLADGTYFLKGLPLGTLTVRAGLEGFQSRSKRISAGEEGKKVVDFCLPGAIGNARISGHVYDESRKPVEEGGTVVLVLPIANKYVHLDKDGCYEFKNLPSGTYKISTSISGHEDCVAAVKVAKHEKKTQDFVCKAMKINEPPWG